MAREPVIFNVDHTEHVNFQQDDVYNHNCCHVRFPSSHGKETFHIYTGEFLRSKVILVCPKLGGQSYLVSVASGRWQ
ncbi:hypothetical protein HAX54_052822, partial [Datura stramonium]|nr:hypothetical protein [Datura stramonium]